MWQPTATHETLRQRAAILATIRAFFSERNILEVETPLLSRATVTDPHVIGIPAIFKAIGSNKEELLYLQTSPEYAMKRLLAAGSGAIYQISKAFRQGEVGTLHNPEFTMLEWYRPGFNHHDLMNDMDDLLTLILKTKPADRITYQNLFEKYLRINPHNTTLIELENCAKKQNVNFNNTDSNTDTWLNVLLTHCIEPQLGKTCPLFLYDFPVSQAALAKIRHNENPPVASRFEVYFKGIELANGFHELQDANEQLNRFKQDLLLRAELGLPDVPIDPDFLAALQHGLPDCAGVALGVDRLVMLALGKQALRDVLGFQFASVL